MDSLYKVSTPSNTIVVLVRLFAQLLYTWLLVTTRGNANLPTNQSVWETPSRGCLKSAVGERRGIFFFFLILAS